MCVQCDFKTTLWECILWLLDSLSEFVKGNIWTPWKCIKLDNCTPYGSLFSVTFRHSMGLCFLFFLTLYDCVRHDFQTLYGCVQWEFWTLQECVWWDFWTFNGIVFGVNFFTFGHCMRVWDDFWTLYGSVCIETFGQPIRVHSVWILDFWTLNGGVFSVTSGLTSASLQLLMNLSIWDSREFSKTSLCSSCPFRQVRIRQRKGWWLKRDLLQEKRWIQNIYVSKGV